MNKSYFELVEYTENGVKILFEGCKSIALKKLNTLKKQNPDNLYLVHYWGIVKSQWKIYGLFAIGNNTLDILQTYE